MRDAFLPTGRLEFATEINLDYFILQFMLHSTKFTIQILMDNIDITKFTSDASVFLLKVLYLGDLP